MPLDGKAWACFSMSLLNSFKWRLAVSRLFAKYTDTLLLQCCFTSTETVRTLRTKSPVRPPWHSHSSWALSERVQVQCCFTSTETVRTIRDREPRTSTSNFSRLLSSGQTNSLERSKIRTKVVVHSVTDLTLIACLLVSPWSVTHSRLPMWGRPTNTRSCSTVLEPV